jgi:hypothetical protein
MLKRQDGAEEFAQWDGVGATAVYLGSVTDLVNVTDRLDWRHIPAEDEGDTAMEVLSLDEIAEQMKGSGVLITVIYERATGGVIYQYGNYCDGNWYKIGELAGYA